MSRPERPAAIPLRRAASGSRPACQGPARRLPWAAVRILFVGDVVGSPGRRAVRELVPLLRLEHGIDLVVANGENSAGGAGVTPGTAGELFDSRVDVITSGDHLWDEKTVESLLADEPRFLRPLNYPQGTPGSGWTLWPDDREPRAAVINLQGRTFMPPLDNPFHAVDRILPEIRRRTKVIFVDMHAEATSEKVAMARFLDGRVTAVAGTHTHIQTADEQILEGGTGFLCDAGCTGGQDGVLGRSAGPVLKRYLTGRPQRFGVAKKKAMLQGLLLEADPASGRCLRVERIRDPLPE